MVCKISGLVQGMSVSASVFTLVAIAVDRFVEMELCKDYMGEGVCTHGNWEG